MEHLLDPIYVGLHILNLIVMVLVLKKLVYKPVSKFMQKRKEDVEQQTKAAEDALSAAKELSEKVELEKQELEKNTRNQCYSELAQAHAKAEQIIADAKQEAQKITKEAGEQAQQLLDAAKEQQRQSAAALAVDIAAAVLPEALTEQQQRELLNASVEEAMKYEI